MVEMKNFRGAVAVAGALVVLISGNLSGQQPAASAPAGWTAAQDHQNMMEQLGIRALRPGPSGNEAAPNHANYDESLANPFPNLPDVWTLKNGKKVTTAKAWWEQRRPEIVEDFDREVLGRVPKNVPNVTWTVANTVNATLGTRAVIGKQLVGHVDSSAYPAIDVDIQMTLVTPADASGPAVLISGLPLPGTAVRELAWSRLGQLIGLRGDVEVAGLVGLYVITPDGSTRVRVSGPLFKPTKLLTTYTRTARRYEGCAKTSTSRCKR